MFNRKSLLIWLGMVGLTPAVSQATGYCPSIGWTTVNGKCRPTLPGYPHSDFYYSSGDQNYPVCGAGRVPVKSTSIGWTTNDLASSFAPRSDASMTFGSNPEPFLYTVPGVSMPTYQYADMTRCMCASQTYPSNPKASSSTAPQDLAIFIPSTSIRRFYDDSIQAIAATPPGNPMIVQKYSPVSLSKRTYVGYPPNARLGSEVQAQKSFCRCPNFNEEMVPVVNSSNGVIGSECRPRVHQHAVLQNFDACRDDRANTTGCTNPDTASLVMDRSNELNDAGDLITEVNVFDSVNGTANYTRRIWVCQSFYKLNTTTGNCEASFTLHAPGPTSIVSPRARGVDNADRWNNTINKKFAACLNGFGTVANMTSTSTKFDCIANNFVKYKDFNELWSSTDTTDDGGLPNAIVLANALGKPITGFYTQDGKHCDEFSEFAGPLVPATVESALRLGGGPDPAPVLGTPLALPGAVGGGVQAYQDMVSGMKGKLDGIALAMNTSSKYVPTSPPDRRRCPLLVRAAAVYTCPTPAPTGGMVVYQEPTTVTDPSQLVRAQCPNAADIKIHMRIEQLTEIKGQPKMPTIDTITNSTGNSSVSIQRIIADKYGPHCPDGTTRNQATGACDPL